MALIAAGRRDALPSIGACCPLPIGANSYIYTPERRAGAAPSPRRAAGCACAADKRPPGPQGGILPVPARFALCAAVGDATAATRLAFCAEISLDDGKAPEWVQLFPRGPQLQANDGRRWRLADPQAVASATAARWGGVDLKLDWEHAHEIKAGTGERVATAGWIKQLAVRDGLLMGRVEWTAAGRQSVESREYRYVSPAFAHANSIKPPDRLDGGDITTLASVALVGRPAFDMPALAGQQQEQEQQRQQQQQQQEESMLKKILEALGLAGDSTEEQALAALAKLVSDLGDAQSLAANPPVEKFVPRELYASALARAETAEGKLASQAKEALAAEAKRELDAAQEAGKFTPAQRPWFDARCAEEGGLEKIRELLGKSASAAPGPGGGSEAPPKATAAGFASDEEASIASMFRRDAKFLNEHAPRSGSNSQGVS